MDLTPEMLEYLQRTGYFSQPQDAFSDDLTDDEMALFLPDDIDAPKYRRAEELRRTYSAESLKGNRE